MQDFWSNLSFSLNATMPVFATMCVGFALHALHLIDDAFAEKLNNFVFRIALPVLLFQDLAEADFFAVWDGRYVLFCFLATLISIALMSVVGRFLVRDVPARGEFIQASYRSSAALLGAAYIENMYQTTGMAPLMIIGAVPLYNIAAVTVLSVTSRENGGGKVDRALLFKTAKRVVTNPIIDGILVGLVWSVLRLPLPAIPAKVVSNIAQTASPLGLLAMGASIDLKKVRGVLGPSLAAVFFKLVGLCALFLPVAVGMGFRTQKLVAILVMLGSPSTVT
ncbi:MAG: AEC family transporter, partial [Lachnospiraceae bacterium]